MPILVCHFTSSLVRCLREGKVLHTDNSASCTSTGISCLQGLIIATFPKIIRTLYRKLDTIIVHKLGSEYTYSVNHNRAATGKMFTIIESFTWSVVTDLPNNAERSVQRNQTVFEREFGVSIRVSFNVTQVPNMSLEVTRSTMVSSKWVEVGACGQTSTTEVT